LPRKLYSGFLLSEGGALKIKRKGDLHGTRVRVEFPRGRGNCTDLLEKRGGEKGDGFRVELYSGLPTGEEEVGTTIGDVKVLKKKKKKRKRKEGTPPFW